MHRQTSLGGRNFCQCGMAQHSLLTKNPQMEQNWSYTRMLPAHMDVVRTFRGSGFTMIGNDISSFQNMCLSNGKNSLQLLLQLSLGATLGGRSASDSTVITSRLSTHGKANLPSTLISCPCCAHFFSQQLKNNFTVSLKHLLGKINEIADALSRKQFICFFHLAPQAQRLPTPTPGILIEH